MLTLQSDVTIGSRLNTSLSTTEVLENPAEVEYQFLSVRTEINCRKMIINKKRVVFGSYKDSLSKRLLLSISLEEI